MGEHSAGAETWKPANDVDVAGAERGASRAVSGGGRGEGGNSLYGAGGNG